MRKCLMACVISLAMAGTAMAGPLGTYVYGSVGYSKAKTADNHVEGHVMDVTVTLDVDNKDIGYKFGIGHRFNPYLALELNYTNLGKYKATATVTDDADESTFEANGSLKSYVVSTDVLGIFPLTL